MFRVVCNDLFMPLVRFEKYLKTKQKTNTIESYTFTSI